MDERTTEQRYRDVLAANRNLLNIITALVLREGGRVQITADEWDRLRPEDHVCDTYKITQHGRTDTFINATPLVE